MKALFQLQDQDTSVLGLREWAMGVFVFLVFAIIFGGRSSNHTIIFL